MSPMMKLALEILGAWVLLSALTVVAWNRMLKGLS